MKDGDVAIIETPTSESVFRILMGADWPGYFPPFHVTVPTAAALGQLAARAGLRVVSTKRREPAVVGSFLHQVAPSAGNAHRWLGLATYPLQIALSKLANRSEAIELTLVK
jgi:hypothetical protein